MKTAIILISITLVFAHCKTPYYTSVNDMRAQPASITLINGTTINGKVNVRITSSYYDANRVSFAEGTSKDYINYKLKEIKSMYINGGTYFVKTIVGNKINRDVQRFVKVISQPGGRMSLYELENITQSNTNNTSIDNNIREKQIQYLVQLPNSINNEIYYVESAKFTPNFDDKMSSYVQDCPALVEKIKSKDKDYFYPFLLSDNSPRRKAVLLQIINDYNNCK